MDVAYIKHELQSGVMVKKLLFVHQPSFLFSPGKAPMYSKTYLALAPVADTAARQRLLTAAAPAIAAGTPLNDELLLSARMELQLREVESQRGLVTRHEVVAAMVREHAILMEHAAAEYPGAVAPMVMPAATLQ